MTRQDRFLQEFADEPVLDEEGCSSGFDAIVYEVLISDHHSFGDTIFER